MRIHRRSRAAAAYARIRSGATRWRCRFRRGGRDPCARQRTGILPEIRDKLFQPFFTTKPTGEGTGLGLSISWDLVTQQHDRVIAVDSKVGEFTEFAIRLPRARQAISAGEAVG